MNNKKRIYNLKRYMENQITRDARSEDYKRGYLKAIDDILLVWEDEN